LKWPYVIFRGLGEDDSGKNLKQKISGHGPFKYNGDMDLKAKVVQYSDLDLGIPLGDIRSAVR
jgi:hypothetical protein